MLLMFRGVSSNGSSNGPRRLVSFLRIIATWPCDGYQGQIAVTPHDIADVYLSRICAIQILIECAFLLCHGAPKAHPAGRLGIVDSLRDRHNQPYLEMPYREDRRAAGADVFCLDVMCHVIRRASLVHTIQKKLHAWKMRSVEITGGMKSVYNRHGIRDIMDFEHVCEVFHGALFDEDSIIDEPRVKQQVELYEHNVDVENNDRPLAALLLRALHCSLTADQTTTLSYLDQLSENAHHLQRWRIRAKSYGLYIYTLQIHPVPLRFAPLPSITTSPWSLTNKKFQARCMSLYREVGVLCDGLAKNTLWNS